MEYGQDAFFGISSFDVAWICSVPDRPRRLYPEGSISELTWSRSVGPRVRTIAMTRAGSFWNYGYFSPSPWCASSGPRGILMKWRRWAWTTSSGRIPRRSVHGLFRLIIQRAPPVCVQLKVWLEAPFLNQWLNSASLALYSFYVICNCNHIL